MAATQPAPTARNARAEARAALDDPKLDPRVLEPSPPAVRAGVFADDPAAVGTPALRRQVVTPTTAGDRSWTDLVAERPELAPFAAERWLAAWPPLAARPPGFAEARVALHVVAFYVLAQARRKANGRIGLRWTRGGFGTPFFDKNVQVRVEGTQVVAQAGSAARAAPITTVRAVAGLVGLMPDPADRGHLDVPDLPAPDAPLAVDDASVAFVAAWFGFGTSVLEQLRVNGAELEPSLVQLWPEHFDLATELGAAATGRRATFGVSPGDADHPEPYLYVAAWQPVDRADPYWNDAAFNGGSLDYGALVGRPDAHTLALDFFNRGLDVLNPP